MILGIDASPVLRPYKTGTENYVTQLLKALRKIIPPTVRVLLYSAQPLENALGDLPGHWENKILTWKLSKAWTQACLAYELRRHPPDIFFSPAHVLPRFTDRRTKLVTTLHDVIFLTSSDAYSLTERWYQNHATKHAVRVANVILVPSQATKQDLVDLCGAREEKIFVTPLGINERYFSVTKEAVKATVDRYGLTGRFFIVVGRLEAKKNTDAIIKTFVSLVETGALPADINLVLAGKIGSKWNEAILRVAQIKYPDRIKHLGWVADEDLPALVSGALGLMLWSRGEGFGLSVLEAMAAGTAVIAAGHSALPEVVGDAGLLVTPDDCGALAMAMKRFCFEPPLVATLQYRGYARVGQFHWQTTAEKTWAAIEPLFS